MSVVSAIIPAAGRSTRFGGQVPKPYVNLCGEPILVHTLRRFSSRSDIAEIILVINPRHEPLLEPLRDTLVSELRVVAVVHGGHRRQDSVMAGLHEISNGTDLVLIHDAVRPLVHEDRIDAVIQAATEHGAAILATPVVATIKQVDENGTILRTVDRSTLHFAQTPQVFRRDLIEAGCKSAIASDARVTDDAQLVEMLGHSVRIVPDTRDNLKITKPEDLLIAESILECRE